MFAYIYDIFIWTGYSVVRSLSEAPTCASAIADILKKILSKDILYQDRCIENNISMQGKYAF